MNYDDETTIPHVTRYDGTKTAAYVIIGFVITGILVVGTLWLLVAS